MDVDDDECAVEFFSCCINEAEFKFSALIGLNGLVVTPHREECNLSIYLVVACHFEINERLPAGIELPLLRLHVPIAS